MRITRITRITRIPTDRNSHRIVFLNRQWIAWRSAETDRPTNIDEYRGDDWSTNNSPFLYKPYN